MNIFESVKALMICIRVSYLLRYGRILAVEDEEREDHFCPLGHWDFLTGPGTAVAVEGVRTRKKLTLEEQRVHGVEKRTGCLF